MSRKGNVKRKKNNDNSPISWILWVLIFVLIYSSIILKSNMAFIGDAISKVFFTLFGLVSYFIPIYFISIFFILKNKTKLSEYKSKIIIFSLLFLVLINFLATFFSDGNSYMEYIKNSYKQSQDYNGVGVIFTTTYFAIKILIGDIGIYIFTLIFSFLSIFFIIDKSIINFFKNILKFIYKIFNGIFSKNEKTKDRKNRNIKKTNFKRENLAVESENIFEKNEERLEPIISYHSINDSSNSDIENLQISLEYDDSYEYTNPPLDLLNKSKDTKSDSEDHLLDNASIIESTLRSFGVESEVVNINNGPTVTSYEVKPQSGIKLSKIVNLSNNLAMSLSAPGIRIEAPIPGKPYVGIEVPNKNKDIVTLKSLLSTEEFISPDDNIKVAIGKDLFGKPLYANINEMPHVLIAGATGSGKSVLMNVIIMSIIYKYSPNEVEFIMIDPKMVELKVYSGIPHLKGRKVITKAQEATASLHQAVKEMTSRFEKFSKTGARDIKAYNAKVEEDEEGILEKMPYLVVIIDELSDLMMEASKDVENYITRLAQMGRASGVHLIIATQRPSVNVITGVIKANIPARIAFQVASNIDSRTIIDSAGAEKLLGKGDMLYFPGNLPKPKRAQGAFVTDTEVERVVEFIKNKNEEVELDENFNTQIENQNQTNKMIEDLDELFNEAVEFVVYEKQASISAIQRRFRVGYARAGRIIDQMTQMGIVSEQDGSKPREVLKTLDDIYEEKEGNYE